MSQSPMARALTLARRARAHTSPNPLVGAVVIDRRTGVILGEGYHHHAGGPHAEILALRQAGSKSRGQTLYVSLEPCNHTGRTPPCTEAIIKAEISTVYMATLDPNPTVSGGGAAALRQAGIEVHIGELGAEAFELNRPFFCWALEHRPLVILKSAMSFDGKVATYTGESKYLTHRAALDFAHEQRRLADAILVGVSTVLKDNPSLTYRGSFRGNDPVRVVLDSHGRTPPDAQLFLTGSLAPTLLFATDTAPLSWERDIFTAGGEVIRVDANPEGHASLPAVMEELSVRRLDRLLVEGGPTILSAFLQAGLADQWLGLIAPIILGQPGLSAIHGPGYATLNEAPKLKIRKARQIGEDALIEADFLSSPMLHPPQWLIGEVH